MQTTPTTLMAMLLVFTVVVCTCISVPIHGQRRHLDSDRYTNSEDASNDDDQNESGDVEYLAKHLLEKIQENKAEDDKRGKVNRRYKALPDSAFGVRAWNEARPLPDSDFMVI
ncbi:uncharacterized protein LOC100373960 [Saccoglossus kowalevskii]|uniref:Uncharacterized protein LOC100373960 n=1 Tax=Saccoglossus kowalevskii TaxID=10224 RepID=A0ABM0GNB5_SACKO|nr:PREDICTED: uncharacterized protein LOC100373960 [Saccoglossus kowalevskii]